MKIDKDLDNMSLIELQQEVMKLRNSIRYHRDQKGHDRCWIDDYKLYALLEDIDQTSINYQMPDKKCFLDNCEKYYNERIRQTDIETPIIENIKKINFL